jgi:ribosomal protein L35
MLLAYIHIQQTFPIIDFLFISIDRHVVHTKQVTLKRWKLPRLTATLYNVRLKSYICSTSSKRWSYLNEIGFRSQGMPRSHLGGRRKQSQEREGRGKDLVGKGDRDGKRGT